MGAKVTNHAVLNACRSRSSNSLDVVRYLIEEAGGPMPTQEELDEIRSEIRQDVVEYLQKKGLLLKK